MSEESFFRVGDIVTPWPWSAHRIAIVLDVYRKNMILIGYFTLTEHSSRSRFLIRSHEWISNDGEEFQAISVNVHYEIESNLRLLYRRDKDDELRYPDQ